MTTTFNKSEIFSNAWAMVKKLAITISEGLKRAWAMAKGGSTMAKKSYLPLETMAKSQETAVTHDDFETIEIHYSEYKNKYSNKKGFDYNADTKTIKIKVFKKLKVNFEVLEVLNGKVGDKKALESHSEASKAEWEKINLYCKKVSRFENRSDYLSEVKEMIKDYINF